MEQLLGKTVGRRGPAASPLQRGQQFKPAKETAAGTTTTTMTKEETNMTTTNKTKDGKTAWLVLRSLNDTFETKSIQLPFRPDVLKIGRQTNKSTVPGRDNGFFDNKVMSRIHAEVWASDNGRIFIKDVKSSNGTFVNGSRLSKENEESAPQELVPGDTLELGIDILNDENGTILHRKVSARVDHAGFQNNHFPDLQRSEKGFNGVNGANGAMARTLNGGNKTDVNGLAGSNGPGSGTTSAAAGRRGISVDAVVRLINNTTKKSMQTAEDLREAIATLDASMARAAHPDVSVSLTKSSQAVLKHETNGHDHAELNGHGREVIKDDSSLAGQLEAAQIAREASEAKIEELQSKLMLEREARIVMEEQFKNSTKSIADDRDRLDDGDTSSVMSLETLTAADQNEDDDGTSSIPHGTDEVSRDNGAGALERLQNLLRISQDDLESWKVRAEQAEAETARLSTQLIALQESNRSDSVVHESPSSSSSSTSKVKKTRTPPPTVTAQGSGKGAALFGVVAVLMFGVGVMAMMERYVPKKEL